MAVGTGPAPGLGPRDGPPPPPPLGVCGGPRRPLYGAAAERLRPRRWRSRPVRRFGRAEGVARARAGDGSPADPPTAEECTAPRRNGRREQRRHMRRRPALGGVHRRPRGRVSAVAPPPPLRGTYPGARATHGGRPQGCIRREGTSEAAPEAVRQAVGGGFQSGWGAVTVGYKCH